AIRGGQEGCRRRDGERERTLSSNEICALPQALDLRNLLDTTKHALMLILATNARVGEVIKARKQDVDLELKIWRVPATNAKTRTPTSFSFPTLPCGMYRNSWRCQTVKNGCYPPFGERVNRKPTSASKA
ncbi:hypothetical protein BZM27_52205, partial [Paraburkholderia steynii]